MPDPRRERVWRRGEGTAEAWYRARGYEVLARNWRCPLGELDLVLRRDGVVVFCEVKARASPSLGRPYEAVTDAKRRKLQRLAETFVVRERPPAARFRFDVASVELRPGRTAVHVFEDAF